MADAVSIAPEVVDRLKSSGQLESIVRADREARAKGIWQANPDPIELGAATDVDTLHCLIILVDFTDMQHEWVFHSEPSDFDTLLFSQGSTYPGSMTDYYFETSYGQAYLIGQVTSWLRMPQTYAYYVDGQRGFGDYPHNAQRLTEDAVVAADPTVDFSIYDNDNDGWVDALFVVHAGPGYEDTGNLDYIHSHAWVTSQPITVDGVQVRRYSMEPEETGSGGFATIGVYCHEFGHVLGLPDLYDYGYDSDGVGSWSVMAGGSWGGGGARPVHFDAWSKTELGWVTPNEPTSNLYNERIDAVEYSPDIYRLFSIGTPSTEYFLVENRQRTLFDTSLPGDGLVIFHVDEMVPNNDDQAHYKVAVEQADGMFDLENNRGSDAGDPWPGTSIRRTFDDFSIPNSRFYNGMQSEVGVYEIGDSDSSMYADLSVMYIDPFYVLSDLVFDDAGGNGNGRPESGEICNLIFTARNIRAISNDLVVTAYCSDPQINFIDSISVFGAIPVDQPFSNDADPITFSVPQGYISNFVNFTLRFVARGGAYTQEFTHRAVVGNPELLLVDDDNGGSIDSFYAQACDSLDRPFVHWNVANQGSPSSVLTQYEYVVWFTGNTRAQALPPGDVIALTTYLNSGGRLLFTSQDFVQRLTERATTQDTILLHQYLRVGYDRLETDHRPLGVPGTVFDSLEFFTSGFGGANNQSSQDALVAYPDGDILLNYRSNRPAAIAYRGDYSVMMLGFGIEGVNDLFPGYYGTRRDLLEAAFLYLRGPVAIAELPGVVPVNFQLDQNFPNPFNPSTRIQFNMSLAGQARLEIFDLLGRIVETVYNGELASGEHRITWDASGQPSGVYFYRLTTSRGIATRRMILTR
jgi:immune inhibitor A